MIKFNKEQAYWLMDFLGNRLMAPKIVLQHMLKDEFIDKKLIRMSLKDIDKIKKFIEDMGKQLDIINILLKESK